MTHRGIEISEYDLIMMNIENNMSALVKQRNLLIHANNEVVQALKVLNEQIDLLKGALCAGDEYLEEVDQDQNEDMKHSDISRHYDDRTAVQN